MLTKTLLMGMGLLATCGALAKDWQVQMLNYGDTGPMVFEPAFIKAQVGDTVTFVPTQSGHQAKSYVVPEGQTPWASQLNEQYTVNLDHEGVHLYYCPPHLMMGMVGVVQVGEPVNQSVIDEKYPRLRSKVALKPERVDEIMANLK